MRIVRSRFAAALATAFVLVGAACAGNGGDTSDLSAEAREGRELYNSSGCAGCHGRDGDGGVGPSLIGLPGSERELIDGSTVIADHDYLVRAIMDPDAEIVVGYNLRMPSNRLTIEEVESLIAYIEELEGS